MGALAGAHGRARLAGERYTCRDRLEVADAAAPARRSVELDGNVTELAGHAVRAMEETAVGEDRTSDPRGDREVDEVTVAATCAECRLSESRDVRVPIEEGREAERRLHLVGERDVAEIRPEVRWLDDVSGPWVDRAG
jgi:hypothetical protein